MRRGGTRYHHPSGREPSEGNNWTRPVVFVFLLLVSGAYNFELWNELGQSEAKLIVAEQKLQRFLDAESAGLDSGFCESAMVARDSMLSDLNSEVLRLNESLAEADVSANLYKTRLGEAASKLDVCAQKLNSTKKELSALYSKIENADGQPDAENNEKPMPVVEFKPGNMTLNSSNESTSTVITVPPKLIKSVAASYPWEAQRRDVEGYCEVAFSVSKKGTVINPEISECSPKGYFEDSTLEAISSFRFSPGMKNDVPVISERLSRRFVFELR